MKRTPKLTKSTTAYGLLDWICDRITEEPKRYNQAFWIHLFEKEETIGPRGQPKPECGTAGCVAGWVVTGVCGRARADKLSTRYGSSGWGLPEKARAILGLSLGQAEVFFDEFALDKYTIGSGSPMYGTPKYAALGVKHIRAFMKANKAQLMKKKVSVKRA